MSKKWILFVASRYIFKGRSNSPVLSVLGIAIGVLALIVIIAVMNGFQLGFIESILEISSYHLRVESFDEVDTEFLTETIISNSEVRAAVLFKEIQAIARGTRTGQQAVIVRGVNKNALLQDSAMAERLEFESGNFDLSEDGSVLLGAELSRRLGVFIGDKITMFSLTGLFNEEEAESESYTVKGIFRTGYYEYDRSWLFLNINENKFYSTDAILGIKLYKRFNDRIALEQIKKQLESMPEFKDIKISSWRDYNRSFFGALRTEKLFMFILVGLIFIVVGLNIYQTQRRSVLQKREEIGLLRAVGGSEKAVRFVFVFDGAVIGFTGASIGLAAGLCIALNIQGFFTVIENVVNGFIRLINVLAGFFDGNWVDDFAVFSPAVFYLKEIPSRILPAEVFIIFMFGFLSALIAAWVASRKIIKIQPAEVLRYE